MFAITDAILIAVFNDLSRYNSEIVKEVLQMCRKANLKLNKNKCHFRFTSITFFWEVISRDIVSMDPRK